MVVDFQYYVKLLCCGWIGRSAAKQTQHQDVCRLVVAARSARGTYYLRAGQTA
jgi:hypothetical protein